MARPSSASTSAIRSSSWVTTWLRKHFAKAGLAPWILGAALIVAAYSEGSDGTATENVTPPTRSPLSRAEPSADQQR